MIERRFCWYYWTDRLHPWNVSGSWKRDWAGRCGSEHWWIQGGARDIPRQCPHAHLQGWLAPSSLLGNPGPATVVCTWFPHTPPPPPTHADSCSVLWTNRRYDQMLDVTSGRMLGSIKMLPSFFIIYNLFTLSPHDSLFELQTQYFSFFSGFICWIMEQRTAQ